MNGNTNIPGTPGYSSAGAIPNQSPTAIQGPGGQVYNLSPGTTIDSLNPGYSVYNPGNQSNTNIPGTTGYNPGGYSGYGTYNPSVSTTTLSNTNKIEQAPKLNAAFNQIADKGIRTDATGVERHADGSFYDPSQNSSTDYSEQDAQSAEIMDIIRSNTDASTKLQIDNIQQKFAQRALEQKEINRRALRGTETALLRGGVTGQGSSAQYAPISSGGIIQAQESYGLKQLAALDSQENDAIAQAKQAQIEQNNKLLEFKLGQINDIRKAKMALAADLNKKAAEQNAKMIEEQRQIEKEQAISEIYSKGVVDTPSILSELKKSGVNATVKEVSDTVALLSGIGGSGIIGEYNFYKAEALRNGQVPVDFNTYQDMDANRKRSIAAAAAAGAGTDLNPKQVSVFNSLVDKYNKSPLVAANDRALVLKTITDQIQKDPTNSSLQVSFIYSLIQALDTYQSAVREGEIGLVSGTQGLGDKIKNLPNKIAKGSVLSTDKVNEYANVAKLLTDTIGKASQIKQKTFGSQAKIAGVGDAFNEYVSAVNTAGTGQDLIQTTEQAKKSVNEFINTNPSDPNVPVILQLYDSGKNDLDVFEWLKLRGVIK